MQHQRGDRAADVQVEEQRPERAGQRRRDRADRLGEQRLGVGRRHRDQRGAGHDPAESGQPAPAQAPVGGEVTLDRGRGRQCDGRGRGSATAGAGGSATPTSTAAATSRATLGGEGGLGGGRDVGGGQELLARVGDDAQLARQDVIATARWRRAPWAGGTHSVQDARTRTWCGLSNIGILLIERRGTRYAGPGEGRRRACVSSQAPAASPRRRFGWTSWSYPRRGLRTRSGISRTRKPASSAR